jgi:hypothetical protein
MDWIKAETQRQITTTFYRENISKGKFQTVGHFKKENVNQRIVYRAMK